MDTKKFKEVEAKYQQLKVKLDQGNMTIEEMKVELKKLMVLDENGHYWMIGGKTGKWYRYDGVDWKLVEPYSEEKQKPQFQQEIFVERQSPIVLETSETKEPESLTCKFCQSKVPSYAVFCSFCGGAQKETSGQSKTKNKENEMLLKYIRIPSLIFFLGGIGVIAGVILGACFGIFRFLGDVIFHFPMMLQETQGKIQGGLIFGAMGGIGGFIVFALLAILVGSLYNLVSLVFGGVRFKIK